MRVLIDVLGARTGEVAVEDLVCLYEPATTPWLRVNMLSSLDGAATGGDGRSGSLNNEPDHAVFDAVRALADVIVVGAGTARAEGYRPTDRPLVVVSRRGHVPERLREAPAGSVLLATSASSPGLEEARGLLGGEQVLVHGEDEVDLAALREALVDRGWTSILAEGGPHLLRDLLGAGVVDEVCVTLVPRIVGGISARIVTGADIDVPLVLLLLLEHDGTLLTRWSVETAGRTSGQESRSRASSELAR